MLEALPIDNVTEYGISLSASTFRVSGRLSITVGAVSHSLDITTTSEQVYAIAPQAYEYTPGLVERSNVMLMNTGNHPIDISYFCLTEGVAQANQCGFTNYDFRDGLEGWTVSGATMAGFDSPMIKMGDGDSISQTFVLDAGTYTITIVYQLPSPQVGTVMIIDYDLEGGAVTGTINLNTSTPNTQTATAEVVVGSGVPGAAAQTFDFTVSGVNLSAFVYIKSICIRLSSAGSGPDLTDATCVYNPALPEGTDVAISTTWHFYQMKRLYNCQVIPILRSIDTGIKSQLQFMGNELKWYMQLINHVFSWTGGYFLPWLAGYMSNVQPGTIMVNDGGCNNLFCLLDGIINSIFGPLIDLLVRVLDQAFNLLFGVVAGLITMALTLIGAVMGWITTLISLFGSFIGIWADTTPTPIPGIPSCTANPPHGICMFWEALDVTFFSGTGALIVPIMSGFIGILIMLRLFESVRSLILKAQSAS
jgi:hypothetical protein